MDAKYMNRYSGTDVLPYEIVEVISDRKVLIRPMATTMAKDWAPDMRPGGFSAHCANNDTQRWDIVSLGNETFGGFIETTTVTRRKNGKWIAEGTVSVEYTPSDTPVKFYDFNF